MPPTNNELLIPVSYPELFEQAEQNKFSWPGEMKQVFQKLFNICWWPFFIVRQKRLVKTRIFRFCRALPYFSDLWRTIQKSSFAYNRLLLGIIPLHRSSRLTGLADLTTVTLFFGDEFIDGLCMAAGKPCIRALLNENTERFYLRKKISDGNVLLEYRFDLTELLPPSVMQKINAKYGISYNKFYILLGCFLDLINQDLARLPFKKAEMAADKIADACNTCFESYLHDVNSDVVRDGIPGVATVLHFHEWKTRYMQKKLLELRCVLANKENIMQGSEAQGWVNIMRVVQIYDDIQDVVADEGFQDNLLVSIAWCHFPGEWQWLSTHKDLLNCVKDKQFLLSLHMPGSIEYCLQLAAGKISTMNWEQQKIMHYLLFNNDWLVGDKKGSVQEAFTFSINGESSLLKQIFLDVKDRMPHLPVDPIKSYVINTCFHLKKERKVLFKRLDFFTAYKLRYNLLSLSVSEKAAIFDRLVNHCGMNV